MILALRLPLILFLNVLLTALSFALSLGLRLDFQFAEMWKPALMGLPLATLIFYRSASYILFGLNRGYWRYASTHDLVSLCKAHAVSSIFFVATMGLFRFHGFPRSVIFIEFCISILLSGGTRLLVRIFCEKHLSENSSHSSSTERQVVVLGAGDSGHLLVKNLLSHNRFGYKPIAVLDDSERRQSSNVHGVTVMGRISDLSKILELYPRISAVLLAIPSFSRHRYSQIEQLCKKMGIPLKRLQSFEDIATSDAADDQISPLSIESLLEKEVNIEHEKEIREVLSGKRILITGAGGSVGSEIVRQIMSYFPSSAVLIDNNELNLFKIEREFAQDERSSEINFVLCDIRNRPRLLQIMRDSKPEIVFHAAAYKHVPMMEDNPQEAFTNNVLGTRNLLDVSCFSGVERFVLISTDKAVDPSNLMGCSKRIAEMLVSSYGRENKLPANGQTQGMSTAVVRFGNVINSTGSVIPLFKEQIVSGGPITVTHPDMERYFMSVREAVRLVLTAGTLGTEGEIYVLDMGTPIRIVEVAQKMLALYARRDIPIVFTGLRPGEKLSEELVGANEQRAATRFKKVDRVRSDALSNIDIRRWVAELEDALVELSDAEIAERTRSFLRKTLVEAKDLEGSATRGDYKQSSANG